jgi:hypothetical protein
MAVNPHNRLFSLPITKVGKSSAGFAGVFLLMFVLNAAVLQQFQPSTYLENPWLNAWFLPAFVIVMLLCGLTGGIFGAIAVIRQHEHSLLSWFGFVIGILLLFLLISEMSQYLLAR